MLAYNKLAEIATLGHPSIEGAASLFDKQAWVMYNAVMPRTARVVDKDVNYLYRRDEKGCVPFNFHVTGNQIVVYAFSRLPPKIL